MLQCIAVGCLQWSTFFFMVWNIGLKNRLFTHKAITERTTYLLSPINILFNIKRSILLWIPSIDLLHLFFSLFHFLTSRPQDYHFSASMLTEMVIFVIIMISEWTHIYFIHAFLRFCGSSWVNIFCWVDCLLHSIISQLLISKIQLIFHYRWASLMRYLRILNMIVWVNILDILHHIFIID